MGDFLNTGVIGVYLLQLKVDKIPVAEAMNGVCFHVPDVIR